MQRQQESTLNKRTPQRLSMVASLEPTSRNRTVIEYVVMVASQVNFEEQNGYNYGIQWAPQIVEAVGRTISLIRCWWDFKLATQSRHLNLISLAREVIGSNVVATEKKPINESSLVESIENRMVDFCEQTVVRSISDPPRLILRGRPRSRSIQVNQLDLDISVFQTDMQEFSQRLKAVEVQLNMIYISCAKIKDKDRGLRVDPP